MTPPAAAEPKVVFLNRYFAPDESATSQMLSDLSIGLVDNGIKVHVVCSRQRYDQPQARLPALETVQGVIAHRVWTTRFGRDRLFGRLIDYVSFYVSSLLFLGRLLQRGDTLVVMTDPPLMSILAAPMARFKGIRLINWLQDVFPEVASRLHLNPLPTPVARLIRVARDWSLRAAQVNVVLGERMKAHVIGAGVEANRVCVIENWAGQDTSEPRLAEQSELRRRLGLSRQFVVGYSGNLGRAHEFDTLLSAAALLADQPDIVFLMIGAGAGMSALKAAVQMRSLGNFLFLPYQPRESLSDSLAAADVHWVSLLPALEGLIVPSKVYGILAARRPVVFIGDPEGEVARSICRNGAGLSVGVGESAKLARQLRTLKSDTILCDAMAVTGYALYRDRFTPRRALTRWLEALRPGERTLAVSRPNPVLPD